MNFVVELSDISFAYPDGNNALRSVSFSVKGGESIGIVGANGAGKSTLLMLLSGVLFPKHGDITIGGVPVVKKNLPLVREKIGMVFQNSDDQLFMTTVFDDVAFTPRNRRLPDEEIERRVDEALSVTGIAHLKERSPWKLSEGEKKSAAIASVLSAGPEILVMDEPASSLDPKSRRGLISLLKGFTHTKIITSHDLDMIYEVCGRVIVLKEGMVAADGPAFDLLSNGELMEMSGLEVPHLLKVCSVCGNKPIPLFLFS